MLKLENVSKVYRTTEVETLALNEISMSAGPGEFVAVMGPSGCGKSTLLNVLGLLDTPTGGSYSFFGEEVSGRSEAQLTAFRRDRIGFVFQSFNLIGSLTAAQNVALPLRLAGRRPRGAEVRETLALVGLADRARHRPRELSGGQQQRVAIARAMVTRPDVLFADEPTGALDSSAAHTVLDLMRQMADAGQAIVMVTHDPAAAARANAVIFLRDGRVVDRLAGAGPREVADRLASWEAAQ